MRAAQKKELISLGKKWFKQKKWKPFPFQIDTWDAHLSGYSGLVNAPTGSGKTYSLFVPIALEFIAKNKKNIKVSNNGIHAIWITPIRSLAQEIYQSTARAAEGLGLDWKIGVRTGDTSTKDRKKLKTHPPELLITTPESLHLLLASKDYQKFFKNLGTIVIDEWHELVGSKRGVQVELALSRFKGFLPDLKVWGISATIGNMEEAIAVLLGSTYTNNNYKVIKADIKKEIVVETILPDNIENFPWAGHIGITLLAKVIPIIYASQSTLIFTNTRAMCELWYQRLLEAEPDLAGIIAMHHGSISKELRNWVEDALHSGQLKAVVCTSSLDLGVDFRPVETIVQIGSPKGVSRFVQRAGRSGHQPGAISKIHFVPTHSLEIIEGSALRRAIALGIQESRLPYIRSFDVLVQYLITIAVSDGFSPDEIFEEVTGTFSFQSISIYDWNWCLNFIVGGGTSLQAYDEYRKVEVLNGFYKVLSRRVAMRHRMSIGTIVSAPLLKIAFVSGKRIGHVEEWFISQLTPGDVFWFGGRSLELVRVKDMTAQVRKSTAKKGKVPSYMGGRMPLSSQLAAMLRYKISEASYGRYAEKELEALIPLMEIQRSMSHIPNEEEFLMEYFKGEDGYHLIIYPFEGRYVHQGIGTLLAYRISELQPISFSIGMNDYGVELLSDQEIPVDLILEKQLFTTENLAKDIKASINAVEMARRQFRDIASIAGLIFKGYPGKQKKDRHLQSSSQLFFEVFGEYEPENLLFLQAFDEVQSFQLEEARLREALNRINSQQLVLRKLEKPSPFAFPIMVDSLRERLTSERLENRVKKMRLDFR